MGQCKENRRMLKAQAHAKIVHDSSKRGVTGIPISSDYSIHARSSEKIRENPKPYKCKLQIMFISEDVCACEFSFQDF